MTTGASGDAAPAAGPVLVFDGDCGICTTVADFVRRRILPPTRGTVAAYQHLDLESLGLTGQRCAEAVQFVDGSGRVFAAQDAVARLLLTGRPWWRPVGALLLVPGVHGLAGVAYRWVARNRLRLPGGTPACALPPRPPSG
jgi:predicted DCC family thiol-disulfide oxidoreductase YuxK